MARAVADYAAAVDFLKRWHPDTHWVLSASLPDPTSDQPTLITATFDAGLEEQAEAWLADHGRSRNLYFNVNPVKKALRKKAKRSDIQSLVALHVDVDPVDGRPLEDEQRRIESLVTDSLPDGVPPPTVVVFSGGGYQAFWRLAVPMEIGGRTDQYEKGAAYNRTLERAFGADACHNVDRIMRIPGTLNRPNKKKRKTRGRKAVQARLVHYGEAIYPLEVFTPTKAGDQTPTYGGQAQVSDADLVQIDTSKVPTLESVHDLGSRVDDRLKFVIQNGCTLEEEGQTVDRSERVFDVACNLIRVGVEPEVVFAVLMEPDFRISEHIHEQKHPDRAARRAITNAVVIVDKQRKQAQTTLDMLNSNYALVEQGGRRGGTIIVLNRDGSWDGMMLGAKEFCLAKNNRTVDIVHPVTGSVVPVPMGDWWLKHPERRTYRRIIFQPVRDTLDTMPDYNRWIGYGVASKIPVGGSCDLFLKYVHETICSGSDDHFEYLVNWMAKAVQVPGARGHVALVLRGGKGTGKTSFADHFGRLFGRHYRAVTSADEVVGRFNSKLADCVLLLADEAFFAGDKKHEGRLKGLITNETIGVERKGVDWQECPNFIHLIMASNEDWVVPATGDERRFFVLNVSDNRKQDTEFFYLLNQQMNAGGYEALLRMLLDRDLSSFNVRRVPKTSALVEQIESTLPTPEKWLLERLVEGELVEGRGWVEWVYTCELGESYRQFASHIRSYERKGATSVIRQLFNRYLGKLNENRDSQTLTFRVGKVEWQARRPRMWKVPSLADFRRAFAAVNGGEVLWEWPSDIVVPDTVPEHF